MYNNYQAHCDVNRKIIKHKQLIITDEDLDYYTEEDIAMIRKLGFKLGKTADEMDQLISAL